MKAKATFAIACILIAWLAVSLARVENERYALSTGMCWNLAHKTADTQCLRDVETRKGWWWHIFYGLTG